MCRQLLHNCRSSSGEKFLPFRAFAASVNAIVATTTRYSERCSERQRAETCGEKDLVARALEGEAANAVTVGAHGLRFAPVPPAKSRSSEHIKCALRML
jgi:hypothetical protein